MSIIQQPQTQCNNYRSPTTNGSRHPSDLPFYEFLSKLEWSILCSIQAISARYGDCRSRVDYWMRQFKATRRAIERALTNLRKQGLIQTKGRGRVSWMTEMRGAIRTITEKAKELLKSRKVARRTNEKGLLESLAGHNSRILNRSYNQEVLNNYLPSTELPTCEKPPSKPPERNLLAILENKLRDKSAKIGEAIVSRAKKWLGKDEKRALNISHPYAYANTLIRQYHEEQQDFRKSAQSAELATKNLNDHGEYKKPDKSVVDNFMRQMLKKLAGLSDAEDSS